LAATRREGGAGQLAGENPQPANLVKLRDSMALHQYATISCHLGWLMGDNLA